MTLHTWVLGTKFTDKRKNKKYPGKTKVYILGDTKLRLDVFDPLGFVTVGSLVINEGQMSLNTIDGKDYEGPVDREKIQALLRVDVNPKDLFSLFMQSGFEDKHWSCAVVENGNLLKECSSGMHRMTVDWSGATTQNGTVIKLDHERALLVFKVKSYKAYENTDTKLFDL